MLDDTRNILFVDDEPFVLKGYQKAAATYDQEWTVFFAGSGREALDLLRGTPIDVIVTDLRMPGMTGRELLEIVSRQYPGVVRFALSGSTEDLMGLQFTNLAHQFLPKPCDLLVLKAAIAQTFQLREMLAEPRLLRLINGIRKLPSPPLIYQRLMKEIQSDSFTSRAVGEIVSQDMALSAKILQIANSALMGMPRKISDLQQAVTVLGINTIKALVLSVNVFSEAGDISMPAFSVDRLWTHSITVSGLAKAIALDQGKSQNFQNNAQIVGLMHDIGKLLQLRVPGYLKVLRTSPVEILVPGEEELLGTNHARMGAYLLGIWGLPYEIVEATAMHHAPAASGGELNLEGLLHIANGLANLQTDGPGGRLDRRLDMEFVQENGLRQNLSRWMEMAVALKNQAQNAVENGEDLG
jgi:HD-like signal output (HDOD) protein/CheY-like chemotaxis protein